MSNVLFLILPTSSHFIPCFPLANDLKSQGYTITFAGNASNKQLIEENQFAFFEFSYMPTFEIRSLKGFLGRILISLFNKQDKIARFKEFKYHRSLISKILFLKPAYVFIDEHLSHYLPYLASQVNYSYIINTKLPTIKVKSIPPLNSSYIPSGNVLDQFICEVIWFKHLLVKRGARLINSIAFLGCSNDFFQKRELTNCKFQASFTDKTSMIDYDNITNVITVSLMSEKFDFTWRKSFQQEISFHYWNVSSEKIGNRLAEIIQSASLKTRIVYCGIGTMANKNSTQYTEFILRLIKIFQRSKDRILLISTGSSYITSMISSNDRIANNIHVMDYVPQEILLSHCCLMITHGGLNSIKECINSCTPMLGVSNPLHKHTDTQGNIARIVHHGIGLKCLITEKEDMIDRKITAILLDDSYKRKLISLKMNIDRERREFKLPIGMNF